MPVKNTRNRSELNSIGSPSFSSLLFSGGEVVSGSSEPVAKTLEEEKSTAKNKMVKNSSELFRADNHLKKNNVVTFVDETIQPVEIFETRKPDAVVVRVMQDYHLERKELHEQKLMANYALSYIDISNTADAVFMAINNNPEPKFLPIKNQHYAAIANGNVNNLLKLQQQPLVVSREALNQNSGYSEEIAMPVALISKRYMPSESIEKSKVVVGRQEDTKSLYVRDHFSDSRTLTAMVADILSRLKSKISDVIINGARR